MDDDNVSKEQLLADMRVVVGDLESMLKATANSADAEVRALAKLDGQTRAARLGLPDAPARDDHEATVASACGSAAADSPPPAGS